MLGSAREADAEDRKKLTVVWIELITRINIPCFHSRIYFKRTFGTVFNGGPSAIKMNSNKVPFYRTYIIKRSRKTVY